MRELSLPYFSVDPIKMALARAVPTYDLNTNASSIDVSEQLWPFLSAVIKNLIETGVPYLVEGEVLPKHVYELRQLLQVDVPACFVGYAELPVEQKLKEVRDHAGFPNDWTSEISDEALYALLNEGMEFSHYLQAECANLNIRYVDFSGNYDTAQQSVVSYFKACYG